MFNNLIESQSHRKEFKRRGRFLAITTAVYVVMFFAAGIGSIYAYDARLEAQNDLMLVEMLAPVTTAPARTVQPARQPMRRPAASNAPVDPHITIPERINPTTTTNDPTRVPDRVSNIAEGLPVVGPVNISNRNANPPGMIGDDRGCPTCSGGDANRVAVPIEDVTPVRPPVSTTRTLPSQLLIAKVVTMPTPSYPAIAKAARAQGPVNVQILVDEQGHVISAHAVSGNAMLTTAAAQAALQARFTPTVLNGTAVKIQGVITYNFVLQ